MSADLQYTPMEITLIDDIIGMLYPLMRDKALRDAYWSVHEHLQSGAVCAADLPRINSALDLVDPGFCATGNKEGYREFTALRLKTHTLLRGA